MTDDIFKDLLGYLVLTRNAAVRPSTDSRAPSLLAPVPLTSVPAAAAERDDVLAVAEASQLVVLVGAVVDEEGALSVPYAALASPDGALVALKGALPTVVVPAVAWVALEDALASPDEAAAVDALLPAVD